MVPDVSVNDGGMGMSDMDEERIEDLFRLARGQDEPWHSGDAATRYQHNPPVEPEGEKPKLFRTSPHCAGDCGRHVDDPDQKGKRWLVLLGKIGQPAYFYCNDCEQSEAEWIERQLGPEGQEAGCTGMVRLETGSSAELVGMVRDIPDAEDDE